MAFDDFISIMSVVGPVVLGLACVLVFGVTAWEGLILRKDTRIRIEKSASGDVIVHSPALEREREASPLFTFLAMSREYLGDVSAGIYPSTTRSPEQQGKDVAWL